MITPNGETRERDNKSLRPAEIELGAQRGLERERLERERLERLYTEDEVNQREIRAWWYGYMSRDSADDEEAAGRWT
jgi:hypothetical protein